MAKAIYVGVDGKARKVKKAYVGVDGVARKCRKGYVGVDGVARQFFHDKCKVTISGYVTANGGDNYSTATINGKTYNNGMTSTVVIEVEPGTVVDFHLVMYHSAPKPYIKLNGYTIEQVDGSFDYSYTITSDTTIQLRMQESYVSSVEGQPYRHSGAVLITTP